MQRVIMRRMIKSFQDREAELIFHRSRSRRLPNDVQRVALRKLLQIDAATLLETPRVPPGNRLEAPGDRKGQHAIRINDQWRICFRWREGDAYDVEIVDYHRG
jgi:toxin HigB-1